VEVRLADLMAMQAADEAAPIMFAEVGMRRALNGKTKPAWSRVGSGRRALG
jgi:hypothetical protein